MSNVGAGAAPLAAGPGAGYGSAVPSPSPRRGPSRQGLTELVLLAAFLALAAAGAIAVFGGEIRAAFGQAPSPAIRAVAPRALTAP